MSKRCRNTTHDEKRETVRNDHKIHDDLQVIKLLGLILPLYIKKSKKTVQYAESIKAISYHLT